MKGSRAHIFDTFREESKEREQVYPFIQADINSELDAGVGEVKVSIDWQLDGSSGCMDNTVIQRSLL